MTSAAWRLAVIAFATLAASGVAEPPSGMAGVDLDGEVVAAVAPEPGGPLFVLVRPARAAADARGQVTLSTGGVEVAFPEQPAAGPDAPRRLLRVAADGKTVQTLADGIGGWTKSLEAIELAGGVELAAGGLGRLASLGPLAHPDGRERPLIDHPGYDPRSLHPERLRVGVARDIAAAEVGALRLWRPNAAGGLAIAADVGLPFAVERRGPGLRLSGPPVRQLARDGDGRRRFAVGPEAMSATRLRVLLIEESEGGWSTTECWTALPAPEEVEESWVAESEAGPLLVVRSQGALEINAFEDQLWRLFRLAPDRTRRGRPPTLARKVDSKRWHQNEVLLADADGDGKSDLLVARPEGLSGGDLVVERHLGSGGGRFDPRVRRTDLDEAPSRFRWLPDVDGGGRPGLATITAGELVVWRVANAGRRALERDPFRRIPLAGDGKEVFELLGALPRPGSPPELLVLAVPEQGSSRLIRLGAGS